MSTMEVKIGCCYAEKKNRRIKNQRRPRKGDINCIPALKGLLPKAVQRRPSSYFVLSLLMFQLIPVSICMTT